MKILVVFFCFFLIRSFFIKILYFLKREEQQQKILEKILCNLVACVDDGFTEALKVNLQRLIMYAQSADVSLQREVAERLANEAVKG